MNIEFSDVTYSVNRSWKDKGDARTILHGVSGRFRTGEFSAIMGPSGAGKSSLLNVLSGYTTHGIKGSLKVNGKPLNRKLFHKSSRYIQQEDLLPPYLTTREAMNIAASLKLPTNITEEERKAVVEDKLALLGLKEAGATYTDRLSGGQKKRLSIALELINNPHVFFLDEPTSGLDNVSTKQCLNLLSLLAKGGRTIVCTIHQPSASLFGLFDNVYVLARGRCVYQGGTNYLLPFLSSAGFRCPTYHNPADYVIEVVENSEINISVLSKAMENGRIAHTSSKEKLNQLDFDYSINNSNISRQSSSDDSEGVFGKVAKSSMTCPNTFFFQFTILLRRMMQQMWRNKLGLQIQIIHHISCGLLIGFCFYNAANDATEMFNHMKFCVGFVLFHTYTHIMMPVLVYPTEVKLLKKEYFNRWYRFHPYYLAYLLTKLPGQLIFGFMFNFLVYFLSGLPLQFFRFALFSFIGLLTAMVADSLGMAIGSIFNVTNGSALGPALVAPFLGLAVYGFDFAREISWLVQALMNLSFMRRGVVATVLTMFGFGRKTLDCSDVYCHFKEPKEILKFVDIENLSVWWEIGNMFMLLSVFRAISYVALRLRLSVR